MAMPFAVIRVETAAAMVVVSVDAVETPAVDPIAPVSVEPVVMMSMQPDKARLGKSVVSDQINSKIGRGMDSHAGNVPPRGRPASL